jgi:DNA polymerase I
LKLKIIDATYLNDPPTVLLACKDLNGKPVVLKFPYLPYFYVRDLDPNILFSQHKPPEYFLKAEPSDFRPYDSDRKLFKVFAKSPEHVKKLAKWFEDYPALRTGHHYGSSVYEANIPFFERFLIDHEITTMIEYNGSIKPTVFEYTFDAIYLDIEVWSENLEELKEEETAPIISISVFDRGKLLNWNTSQKVDKFQDYEVECKVGPEEEILRSFLRYIRKRYPDIIVTFTDFDMPYVLRRADKLGIQVSAFSPLCMTNKNKNRLYGIQILDYRKLYCKVFNPPFSNLDYIAKKELGYGKLECEVYRDWQTDPKKVIEYNLMDALLLARLEEKLDLINSFYKPIRDLTGLPFDMCMINSKVGMNLHLRQGRKKKIAFRTKSVAHPRSYEGAYVFAKTGLFENVLQYDFSELYPSIMETFHISADTKTDRKENVVTIGDVSFRLEDPGITNEVLEPLRQYRREIKKKCKETGDKRYEMLNMALKQVVNSAYGIYGQVRKATKETDFLVYEYSLGSPLYDPQIAETITKLGKEILIELIEYVQSLGYEVLYADTDSLFIKTSEDPETLRKMLEEHVRQYVESTYQVPSKLSISFEGRIQKLLVVTKKRYVALKEDGKLVFKGLEVVRKDTSNLMIELLSRFVTLAMNGASIEELKRFAMEEERKILNREYPLQDLALRARCAKKKYEKVETENKKAMEWANAHGFKIEYGERFFKLYVLSPEGVVGYPSEKDIEKVVQILEKDNIPVDYRKLAKANVQKLWNIINYLSKENLKTSTLDSFFGGKSNDS